MPTEREWVNALAPKLEGEFEGLSSAGASVCVSSHKKLLYAHEIGEYKTELTGTPVISEYQTDLLIYDQFENKRWIPRVVIEGKLGGVTTHDAVTYSEKARTHKQVHPYLRYGILIGGYGESSVPGRLFRHGAYFDFMVTWKKAKPSEKRWADFIAVLNEEVTASREIQYLLRETRSPSRRRYGIVHRPLVLKK